MNNNNNGKTARKEVCTNCKCIVTDKPTKQGERTDKPIKPREKTEREKTEREKHAKMEEKNDCVATIVGVLSLPENFCSDKRDEMKEGITVGKKKETKQTKNGDRTEVYRDVGECLQKCIVQGAHAKGRKLNEKSLNG